MLRSLHICVCSWLVIMSSVGAGAQASEPRTVDKGDQSNIDEAKQVAIRSDAEWSTLWTRHGGERKKPAVDFSREMVVGIFMGSRPTAGYTTTILSAFNKDGKMLVRYQETIPAKGTMTAQIITSPYHLVAVPRVTGSVTFEKAQIEK